jgi:DNA-binding LacI/PurR family transcriptional regulator
MGAGVDRASGWRAAHDALGLDVDEQLLETGNFSIESGTTAMRALLDRAPDLDAVFCANDLMAIGAMQVLRDARRTVPDDVAIIGFDDIDAASHASPPLTTVAQDIDTMGRRMAELLLLQLGGQEESVREVLPTRLVVRSSG